jgi:hypothetical protein
MGRRARLMLGQAGVSTIAPAGTAATLALASGVSSWLSSLPSFSDFLANAATGNLSQNQIQQLQAEEQAALVKAGASSAAATQQSQQDVSAVLATFTAPGAFGITWTGAAPGGADWLTQAESDITGGTSDAGDWLSTYWPWLAIAGIGAWWISKQL